MQQTTRQLMPTVMAFTACKKSTIKVEGKKTYKADLERRRPVWFLLGLIVALSLLLTALEYSTTNGNGTAFDDNIDDISQDLDLLPSLDRHDMTTATPRKKAMQKTDKLLIVDKPIEKAEKLDAVATSNTNENNGDGAVEGSSTEYAGQALQTQEQASVSVDANDTPLNFRIVEQLPEFPGGMSALVKWLTDNIKYPKPAQMQKIEGQVVVSFIINRDGTVADIKLAKSVHPLLDREALRVARMMPKWKPGLQNNKPCRTLFAIPIIFKI